MRDTIYLEDLYEKMDFAMSTLHKFSAWRATKMSFWPFVHSTTFGTIQENSTQLLYRQGRHLRSSYRQIQLSQTFSSLAIAGLCLPRDYVRGVVPPTSVTSRLSHLAICMLSNDEHKHILEDLDGQNGAVDSSYAVMEHIDDPLDFFPPAGSPLTTLDFGSPRGMFHIPVMDFEEFRYPQLIHLSLDHVSSKSSSSPDSLFAFILRHKATLRKLELHSCFLQVEDINGADEEFWSHIWDKFSKELTQLSDLRINQMMRYILPSGKIVSRRFISHTRVAEDEEAQNRFLDHSQMIAMDGMLRV